MRTRYVILDKEGCQHRTDGTLRLFDTVEKAWLYITRFNLKNRGYYPSKLRSPK